MKSTVKQKGKKSEKLELKRAKTSKALVKQKNEN